MFYKTFRNVILVLKARSDFATIKTLILTESYCTKAQKIDLCNRLDRRELVSQRRFYR